MTNTSKRIEDFRKDVEYEVGGAIVDSSYEDKAVDAIVEQAKSLIMDITLDAQITTVESMYKNGDISAGVCVKVVGELKKAKEQLKSGEL